MEKSETIGKLAEALAAAQAEMGAAIKDSNNPFFKSKYADLASIIDAIRGPLTKHGIAVIQTTEATDNSVTVETILAHSSGEWISGKLSMKPKDMSPQAVGSAISYACRYGLRAIVVIPTADDDGEAAEGRAAKGPSRDDILQKCEEASCADHLRNIVNKYGPEAKEAGWFRDLSEKANAIAKDRGWNKRKEGGE